VAADRDVLSDHSALADPMEAWKARGRELNEIYDALTEVVREPAPGFDPVADLKALGAERDRLRSAIEEYVLWEPGRRGHAAAHRRLREALNGGEANV
jgi:hypothetical protein